MVAQSLLPGFSFLAQHAYAQEIIYTPTVTATPTAEQDLDSPGTLTEQPTPTDTIAPNPTEMPTPTPTSTETVIPTPSVEPTTTTAESPKETGPPEIDQILYEVSTTAEAASTPLWQSLDSTTDQTTVPVEPGREYRYRNTSVSVVFTKLPESPGTLTIKEVKLTAEQQEALGAFSDTAYDITSSMPDGTFTYNLTLPIPPAAQGQTIEMKSAETVEDLIHADTVDQPKNVTLTTVTIKNLDHFTVFVLVNDIDTDNPDSLGDADDIANGVISAIDDTFIDEKNPSSTHGSSSDLNVRSKSTNDDQRSLVKFDTSSLSSGTSVIKATLRLFMNDDPPSSRSYDLYRITSAWNENTVNWTSKPTTAPGTTDSTDTEITPNVWLEWDVTPDVQEFINGTFTNYGWMIQDSSEEAASGQQGQFKSSEDGTESKRPQLVVDFSEASDEPTEYKSPTAEAATTGGDGNGFEASPDNAFADGGGEATNSNGAGDRHLFFDYNPFDIPEGSTINGIEVRVDWYLDSTGGTNSLDVELSYDGGTSWTSAKSDITETNAEHVASLGGSSDTWDRTWDATEFSDANFRVRVTSSSTDGNRDFFLDWIPVRVYYTAPEEDTTPPTSTFSSPSSSSYWNSAISIEGSSTDVPDTTVDFVTLYASLAGDEDWGEIAQIQNENLDEPFEWSFDWTPEEEGTYDIKAEATDTAGNTEGSPVVEDVMYDVTDPTSDITYPEDEVTYNQNTWGEEISGIASDSPSSGISTVFVSVQRDSDDAFWDGDGAEWVIGEEEEEEYPNEADFDGGSGTWSYEFDFINPEGENEGYTARSHAQDNAGNLEDTNTVHFYFSNDVTPPVSIIDSPEEGSVTNSPIVISGSSDDESEDTVDFVKLFYREAVDEEESENEWTEIDTLDNSEGDNPFNWDFTWTPPSEGTFDIKAEATDTLGNTETSPEVHDVTYDTTPPTMPTADPAAGDYTSDQSVTLASDDGGGSGVASIFYTIDGSEPSDTNGTLYGDAIAISVDTTLKAIAYDNAGNPSDVLTAIYGIAPVISAETSSSVTATSTTITWTTDDPATSRVIYDTVSHGELGAAPNYGYANSTVEADTSHKVTSHSVSVSGLTASTTYFFRTVSHGSPESVSSEKSFATTTSGGGGTTSGGGGGGGGGTGSPGTAPVCGDTKPGSAPSLTTASAGTNSVTLTWTKASDPTSYYLVTYGLTSGAQTWGNPNVGGAGTTSYTISGLSGGVTYYFKVRAGNGCMPGDYSNELSATPGGGTITGPAAGFAPGVLGAVTEDEATPSPSSTLTPSPTPEEGQVLGTQTNPFGDWITHHWSWLAGFGAFGSGIMLLLFLL